MALSLSTTVRNARASALVSAVGTNGTMRFYTGTRPASLGAVTTQTLLATLTFAGSIGTVSSGILTFNSVTQNSGSHVNGNPTWVRISAADNTPVMDIDIGVGSSNMQFTGAIANGTNITLNASTLTEPNA